LIVGAIGILVAIVAVVAIILPFADVFRSDVYPAPGQVHLHLDHERYTVYERAGFAFGRTSLTPGDLTVTAVDRSTVPVAFAAHNETIDRGGGEYRSALEFEPPASGDYTLEFSNQAATTVMVARSLEDTVRSVLVWFGVGALGGLLLVAGIVMLVVGITRRSRAKRAAYAGWAPPGTWYPGYPPPQWGPPGAGGPASPPPGYPPGYGPPGSGSYPPSSPPPPPSAAPPSPPPPSEEPPPPA
jgi:hypothetical protein